MAGSEDGFLLTTQETWGHNESPFLIWTKRAASTKYSLSISRNSVIFHFECFCIFFHLRNLDLQSLFSWVLFSWLPLTCFVLSVLSFFTCQVYQLWVFLFVKCRRHVTMPTVTWRDSWTNIWLLWDLLALLHARVSQPPEKLKWAVIHW